MPPNFPTLPQDPSTNYGNLTFPADLIHGKLSEGGRDLYTQINFVTYNVMQQFNSRGSSVKEYSLPSGNSIKLPIPLKLNDTLVLNWSQPSLLDAIKGMNSGIAATISIAQLGGIGLGAAINPLMFQQFQRPEFRQFSLSWLLAPKNEKESKTISKIIKKCKQASSPTKMTGGLLMGYPEVAMIQMMPDDIFGNLIFKPCVVTSVAVNYNAAPNPSFFKNGAPTIVGITLNLMEMQFWFRDEIK